MLFFTERLFVSGALFGVVGAAIVIAALSALVFARRAYWYIALWACCYLGAFALEMSAYADSSALSAALQAFLRGGALVSAMLFARNFFETGVEMWQIDRALRLGVLAHLALPVVAMLGFAAFWQEWIAPALHCYFFALLAFIGARCFRLSGARPPIQRTLRFALAVNLLFLSALEIVPLRAGNIAYDGGASDGALWRFVACAFVALHIVVLTAALFAEAGREHDLYESEREERNIAEVHAVAEHRRSDALRRANAEILAQQELLERQARQIEGMNNALFENNRQLAEQNLALKELHREKDELLGVVAHDLKNPLSNIASFASVLQHDDASLEARQRGEFLGLIVDSADRMFQIIRNLLDINALERGGMRAHLQAVEMSSLLEYGVSSYKKRALEKNIVVAMNFQPAPFALGDEHLIMQVFDNLLSNALKYSPHNTTVRVELSGADGKVRFGVRDEGPGLTEEDKQKLFGKFARLSAEPTGGEHSTGLGLSIVKKMVEMMNGEVRCESESGKGAAFIVELKEYKPEQRYEAEGEE